MLIANKNVNITKHDLNIFSKCDSIFEADFLTSLFTLSASVSALGNNACKYLIDLTINDHNMSAAT